ncbi:hypothetical protein Sjap_024475 [Stephania japonica]|uniref:Uncharacterized protein n=1 Tax=Stephania japonica TaxID=461633 RepID=A0AAP0EKN6_9MAGN
MIQTLVIFAEITRTNFITNDKLSSLKKNTSFQYFFNFGTKKNLSVLGVDVGNLNQFFLVSLELTQQKTQSHI